MKIERAKRHPSEVNAGALTDIMFFLLLFFLIVSTMTNPNVIKLLLPESGKTTDITKNPVIVSISANRNFYVGKEKKSDADSIPAQDLLAAVQKEMELQNNATMVVKADRSVPVAYLVKAMDVGITLNMKVVMETRRATGS